MQLKKHHHDPKSKFVNLDRFVASVVKGVGWDFRDDYDNRLGKSCQVGVRQLDQFVQLLF